MRASAAFLSISIGLGLGIALASIFDEPDGSRRGGSAKSAPASRARSDADAAPRYPGTVPDDRIARLFSALHQPIALRRRHELRLALADIRPEEIPRLVERADKLPQSRAQPFLAALVERWLQSDPDAAGDWIMSKPFDKTMLTAWCHADPEGAIRRVSEPDARWKVDILGDALMCLYSGDYSKQVSRLLGMPSDTARDWVLHGSLLEWASTDPKAAVRAFESSPLAAVAGLRQDLILAGLEVDRDWVLAEVDKAMPTLKAGLFGNGWISEVARELGAKDPRVALEWLGSLPEEFRSAPARRLARSWAEDEPMAALAWCLENGVDIASPHWEYERDRMPSVLAGAMATAPREVFDWIRAMPEGPERTRLIETAFTEATSQAPPREFFGNDAAMAWEIYHALPDESQVATAGRFVRGYLEVHKDADPIPWLREFPAGEARSNAIAAAVETMGASSPEAATALLERFQPGIERDSALIGMAGAFRGKAPMDGVGYAMQIGDPGMQRVALGYVIDWWLRSDPAASRRWIESAPIPPEWKSHWLKGR